MLSPQAQDFIKMLFASKNTQEEKDNPEEILAIRKKLGERRANEPLPEGMHVTAIADQGIEGEYHRYDMGDKTEDQILLLLYGGGFMTGSVLSSRTHFSGIAKESKMDALAITYTQWPEGEHPAALMDCIRAFEYLKAKGYEASKIHIYGESAGAILALTTVLTLKDQGNALPGSVCVFSPVAGPGEPLASRTQRASRDPMIVYRESIPYYGNADRHDFRLAARYGDYRGFPRTMIHVGSEEVLYDDAKLIYNLAKLAGVDVRFREWDELFHCFLGFPIPEAQHAIKEIGRFVRNEVPEEV